MSKSNLSILLALNTTKFLIQWLLILPMLNYVYAVLAFNKSFIIQNILIKYGFLKFRITLLAKGRNLLSNPKCIGKELICFKYSNALKTNS